jgi:uncharacterized protein (TIGR03083 family)
MAAGSRRRLLDGLHRAEVAVWEPSRDTVQAIDTSARTIGGHYHEARLRLDALLRPVGADAWERSVPACPGWRVHDVVAHLLGNIEDGAAGRITGMPSEALTAEQVERHRRDRPTDLLDQWAAASPFMEEAISVGGRWPAAIDVLTHEHDVRGALEMPGARDHESIKAVADLLSVGLSTPVPVAIHLRHGSTDHEATLTLRTTPYDLFRLRLGRRSRAQVCDLDWSDDPEPVVDHLFIFGPSPEPIIE